MAKIEIDVSEYTSSHLQAPRGRGSWAFRILRKGAEPLVLWSSSMTYTEAKQWARDRIVREQIAGLLHSSTVIVEVLP
jgi:hypothetical protein